MTWHADAACRGRTAEMYPNPTDRAGIIRAQAICAACRVRNKCTAASAGESSGVWAGTMLDGRPRRRYKWCPGCRVDRALDQFGSNPSRHDGLHGECRECVRIRQRERRQRAATS